MNSERSIKYVLYMNIFSIFYLLIFTINTHYPIKNVFFGVIFELVTIPWLLMIPLNIFFSIYHFIKGNKSKVLILNLLLSLIIIIVFFIHGYYFNK